MSGGKQKTFPYYDRLDGLLGTRPTVNPVALSDSLINEDEVLAGHPKVQLKEQFPRGSTLLLFYSP
jgi:hypothetical protein